MGSFGSKAETPQEQMKSYKREVDRAVRELDRERTKMERQNERLAMDIRKAAKNNQTAVVKIMAKDYVRVKRQVTKFYQLKTHLQGVSLQLMTMKSVDAMANAIKNTTRAMVRMNQRLNIPQLTAIMRSFGIESERMEMTSEAIGDTLDDVFAVDGEEEEEDELVKQVMTELQLEMGASIPSAPVGASLGTAAAAPVAPVRTAAAVGGAGGPSAPPPPSGGAGAGAGGPPKPPGSGGDGGGGGGMAMPSAPPPSAPSSSSSSSAGAGGAGGGGGASDLAARLAQLRAGSGP